MSKNNEISKLKGIDIDIHLDYNKKLENSVDLLNEQIKNVLIFTNI